MIFNQLGRSGLRVSALSLGSWLTYGMATDEASAHACLQLAYDSGINFFDTANVYNRGGAETLIGEWLQSGIERDKIILASKVFFPMSDHWMDRGLSLRHITTACGESLERLQTEYLDLYQCHRYDEETPLEETCFAMHQLIQNGWILHWGVSQWTAVQILRAMHICESNGWRKPISNQPIYNMLNRSLEVDVIQLCEQEGLGLVTYSPLSQGLLSGKYRGGKVPKGSRAEAPETNAMFPKKRLGPETDAKLDQLEAIAKSLGGSLSQLALAWCLRRKPITSVILGATSTAQLTENLGALKLVLDDATQLEIELVLGNAPVDQYSGQPTGYGVVQKFW
jgi:voltage-dependent potassium channel beta subunit